MQLILATLTAFSLASATLHADDPHAVTLTPNGHLFRGAVDLNNAGDALKNNLCTVAELQAALLEQSVELSTAKNDLAALRQRITATLRAKLADELKTGEGPKVALLRALQAEVSKSDDDIKREVLEAEIATKLAELERLKD